MYEVFIGEGFGISRQSTTNTMEERKKRPETTNLISPAGLDCKDIYCFFTVTNTME